jgi:TetR/AcrR family transcriptional regulator, repressor for uid operon
MSVTSERSGDLGLGSVLGRVLARSTDIGSHPTNDRIMDATLEELAESGLAELVVENVARRARVTRMTVYRRFGDRQRLIEATMERESARLLAAVAAADDPGADPVDRIVRTLTTSLTVARRHPLVAHWLATKPGELLDAVLANDAAVLRAGAAYVAATIRAASVATRPSRGSRAPDPDRTGDLLVRLFAALVLMPPPSIDLDDPRHVEALARDLIAPILVSTR